MQEVSQEQAYENLENEIIIRAVTDYTYALRKLKREPDNVTAQYTAGECERFFRENIRLYSDLDGETIIKRCKEKVFGGKK